MKIRAASVAWKLRRIRSDADFFGHAHDLISNAHDEGANVVVLPELFCLELLQLAPRVQPEKAPKYLVQYESAIESWLARIAQNSGMVIIGGSHFKARGDEAIRNVCPIAFPDGTIAFQEKNNLTVYERDDWGLENGEGLANLPNGLGVTVCYDCEFPEAGRVLANNGTVLQCVPAWTETQRGFQRVRWSCLARAIENQIFVIHASLLGDLGREPVPMSYGSAAILAPSNDPFPPEAILRESELNEEGVVLADLDTTALNVSRLHGEVTNWQDRSASQWLLGDKVNADVSWPN